MSKVQRATASRSYIKPFLKNISHCHMDQMHEFYNLICADIKPFCMAPQIQQQIRHQSHYLASWQTGCIRTSQKLRVCTARLRLELYTNTMYCRNAHLLHNNDFLVDLSSFSILCWHVLLSSSIILNSTTKKYANSNNFKHFLSPPPSRNFVRSIHRSCFNRCRPLQTQGVVASGRVHRAPPRNSIPKQQER